MALNDLASYACEGNDLVSLSGRMFATIYAWVPTTAGIAMLLFAMLHRLLRRSCASTYGTSSLEQQLVTATHALYAALYAIQLVPYTYLVCRILFADNFLLRRASGSTRVTARRACCRYCSSCRWARQLCGSPGGRRRT